MTSSRIQPRRFRLPAVRLPAAGMLGLAALSAMAQESTGARTVSLTSDVSLSQTFTDNLDPDSSGPKRGGSITEITPHVHFDSRGGRVKGYIDYSLSGLYYAGSVSSGQTQHALDANMTVEAIQDRGFIDVRASVAQQSVSAFGTQSADTSQRNGNQAQVSTIDVQPYLRGFLSDLAQYEARLRYAKTHGDTSGDGDSTTGAETLHLGSIRPEARLGWSLDASNNRIDYTESRPSEITRVGGGLILAATPELRFSGRIGREVNNVVSEERVGNNTPGWGVSWTPSDRTHVSFDQDRRFFGQSHALNLEYRTPRTVWRYTDTRDIGSDAATNGSGGRGLSNFDDLFGKLATVIPDPALRAQIVNAVLLANGRDPAARAQGSFLNNAVTVERRQALSLALIGIRGTVTFSISKGETSRLDSTSTATDDLANGNVLKQLGFNVDVGYRLTPLSSLNLAGSREKSTGSVDGREADLRSLTVTWSTRLNPKLNVSLGARHASFESNINPYTETAIIGTATLQF